MAEIGEPSRLICKQTAEHKPQRQKAASFACFSKARFNSFNNTKAAVMKLQASRKASEASVLMIAHSNFAQRLAR